MLLQFLGRLQEASSHFEKPLFQSLEETVGLGRSQDAPGESKPLCGLMGH